MEDTDLMSSDPIKLNVSEGQTVEIYSACQQNKPEGPKCLCYQRLVLGGWWLFNEGLNGLGYCNTSPDVKDE